MIRASARGAVGKEGSMPLTPHPAGAGQPSTRRVRLKKVLVVDPGTGDGEAVARVLEEAGYYLNRTAQAAEGRRRAFERVYDLVVLSAALGEPVLKVLVDDLGSRPSPPPVLVLAGPEGLKSRAALDGMTCVMVLRAPFAPQEAAEAARTLAGAPWDEPRPA
jgi:DNA-binding response OmpR family regulator